MYTGCRKLWIIDGNWKLNFPHCMFPVKIRLPMMTTLDVSDVCINQPKGLSSFCEEHHEVALKMGYPTKVKISLSFVMERKQQVYDFHDVFLHFCHVPVVEEGCDLAADIHVEEETLTSFLLTSDTPSHLQGN